MVRMQDRQTIVIFTAPSLQTTNELSPPDAHLKMAVPTQSSITHTDQLMEGCVQFSIRKIMKRVRKPAYKASFRKSCTKLLIRLDRFWESAYSYLGTSA